MRKFFMTAFALSAMLVLASSSFALEKTAARLTDDSRADAWNAGTTCTVAYYNFCAGWVWILSELPDNYRFGVSFDTCCGGPATLTDTWELIYSGVPSGYGFTGTLAVNTVDAADCLTGVIASQAWLPVSGWNLHSWNLPVPADFALTYTTGPGLPGTISPLVIYTDAPALSPCHPPRLPHSWEWTGNCPVTWFFDGVGNSELVFDATLINCSTISVEPETWGGVKNLYR